MITNSLQQTINDQIAIAKANNAKFTEAIHLGHNVITQRWDSMHVIKVCEYCGCTVSNIMYKPTDEIVESVFTGVFGRRNDGNIYKVGK